MPVSLTILEVDMTELGMEMRTSSRVLILVVRAPMVMTSPRSLSPTTM